jgi:putative transposase
MIRTYKLKQLANNEKQIKIISVIKEYRKTAITISNYQWKNFFLNKRFNKNLDIKHLKSKLSERYKQTNQYQVVGILQSYLSNIQNKFVQIVYKSSFDSDTKMKLFFINKYQLWFNTSAKLKGEPITPDILKIARQIMKNLFKKNKKPDLSKINLSLDKKVVIIEKSKTTEFEYWIKLSTLEAGKPVSIPLKSNKYFESIQGELKNFCQINLNRNNELSICLIKDVPDEKESYTSDKELIGIDIGLCNLITLDNGNMFGKNIFNYLKHYDQIITNLAKNLQKQKIKLSQSKRYCSLVKKVKNYLKNEINRIFNKVIKLNKPKEIVLEKLDFRNMNLSKKLNRIISKFGKSYIISKLESLSEKYGIKVTFINPAFTSQECNNCHYVDKNNRKTQEKFICKCCDKKLNADVNASRNIVARRSSNIEIYLKKQSVLNILTNQFAESIKRLPRLYSKAITLISSNPYFKDRQIRIDKVKLKYDIL